MNKFQAGQLVRRFNRKHIQEHFLEATIQAFVRRHIPLKEFAIRLGLNLDEIGKLVDVWNCAQ